MLKLSQDTGTDDQPTAEECVGADTMGSWHVQGGAVNWSIEVEQHKLL